MPRPALRSILSPLTELLPWLLLGVLGWTAACMAPLDPWVQPRIAASYALAAGRDLYPDFASGAQLCWLYGPVPAYWLLPVTWLPSLAWAEAAGVILNTAAPLAALAWCLRADLPGWRAAWNSAGWSALLLVATGSTVGWIGGLHVDAPCVALLLVSLGAARRHRHTAKARWLHLAALAAILACWCKQLAALFPVALAVLWLAEGRGRLAGRWLVLCAAYGATVSAAFIARFGFDPLLFHTVTIHLHLPWRSAAAYFGEMGPNLVLDFLPWLSAVVLPGLMARLTRPPAPAAPASPAGVPAGHYAALGLLQLPLGLLAALKEGGGLNSAYGLLFLGIATAETLRRAPLPPLFRLGIVVLLGLLTLTGRPGQFDHWRPHPYQDELLAVARTESGRLYLPWNPLVTLLTDGRVYPFEYALFAREITGFPVAPEAIRTALPAGAVIAYDRIAPTRNIRHYLPGPRALTWAELTARRGAGSSP